MLAVSDLQVDSVESMHDVEKQGFSFNKQQCVRNSRVLIKSTIAATTPVQMMMKL
jgi:hypothetical protein